MNRKLASIALFALVWSSVAFCGEIHDAAKAGDLEEANVPLNPNSVLKSRIPAYAAKVEKIVARLERETPSESVFNLYYVTEYFDNGPGANIITDENRNQVQLDLIMNNRRFRKVFSELGSMDKAAATQLVKTNLMSAMSSYSRQYENCTQQAAPLFKGTNEFGPGLAFTTGFIKPEDAGKETLIGEKMKVFSLVWISGMLRLTDNQEQVEQVVRYALKQKSELDNDPTLQPRFKWDILGTASLYNRQILSTGLIGVTLKDAGMEPDAMKAAGIQWQQRTLVAYDAALTEFDRPVQSGMMAPDGSTGSLTVNFVSPMNDTNFDELLQQIHFK